MGKTEQIDKALTDEQRERIQERLNDAQARRGYLTSEEIELQRVLSSEQAARGEIESLKWKIAHPVICLGICTSQLDDYCGMHMSNESCIACNSIWTAAHVENAVINQSKQLNQAVELLKVFVKRTSIDHSYVHTLEYRQAQALISHLSQEGAVCKTCKGKRKIPKTGSAMYWPDRFPDEFIDCPECQEGEK